MDKNSEDKNVEKAIDDIFGTDFIEIDVSNKDNLDNLDSDVKFSDDNVSSLNSKNNIFSNWNEDTLSSNEIKNSDDLFNHDKVDVLPSKSVTANIDWPNEKKKVKEEVKKQIPSDMKKENNKRKRKQVLKISYKKSPYIILVIILVLMISFVIFLNVSSNKKELVTNCSYNAEDVGYKIIDEYKITRLENKIKYVDESYIYKAKNDEYKAQIEYVKEEKIPVIINSNGMSGFTYLYEIGEDYFSVNGYLDFTLIEFNKIDKINFDTNPVSYIKISSKTNYSSLIKQLKSNGYKCVSSK